ncbi:MAG: DedA family protein [Dermatophilaceae bacterium]
MSVDGLLISVSPVVVYVLVALVVGLESMGIPLPGEVILVSAGLLASRADLGISAVWVAVAATAGAILGDSIGYLAGRRWGYRMFDVLGRWFPKHAGPDHLSYAKHVFARYGVWAVFFGRFVALLRIFAGPLAGALRMPYPRFLAANAAGGLVWACGTTVAVYSLGASADQWLKEASWMGLAVALGIGITVSMVFRRRLARAVARHALTSLREDAARQPTR